MAGNIKGITIEIGADTSKMNKALRTLQSPLKKIESELKQIDKALKLDPKNTALLKQKMELLEKSTKEADSQVKQLKAALSQMKANGAPEEQIRRLERELATAETKAEGLRKELALFKASQSTFGKISTSLAGVGDKLTNVGNSLRGFSIAAAAAAGAMGGLAYKTAMYADDINTLSAQTGVATDTLQKFGAISELVDVDLSALAKGQGKIIAAMRKGSDAFDQFGIKTKKADGTLRDSETVFMEYIRAVGELGSETEQAAAMQEMFGTRAYQALMPLVKNIDQFDALNSKLDEMGLALDQDALDKMNEFNDQIDWLKAVGTLAFYKIGSAIGDAIGPHLETAAQKLADFANWVRELDPRITKFAFILAGVGAALAPAILIAGKFATALSSVFGIASKLGPVFGMSFGSLPSILTKIAGPIGIAVALFAALWTQSDSFREAVTGLAESLISALLPVFKALQPLLEAVGKMFSTLIDTLGVVLPPIIEALTPLIALCGKAFAKIAVPVASAVTGIVKGITKVIDKAKQLAKPFTEAKDKIKKVMDKIKGFFPIKIGKILKNIKLPHFSLKWKSKDFGKLGKISWPTGFNVNWYKKGGIFNSPSIVGVGEAGREAVVPIEKLKYFITDAISETRTSSSDIADAVATAIAVANTNPNQKPIQITVNLGGAKVAEQIFKLNKQGKLALQG